MAKHDRLIEVAARVKTLRDQLRQAEAELEAVLSGKSDESGKSKAGTVADLIVSTLIAQPPANSIPPCSRTSFRTSRAERHAARSLRLAIEGQSTAPSAVSTARRLSQSMRL